MNSTTFNDSIFDFKWFWTDGSQIFNQDTCCIQFNPELSGLPVIIGDNSLTLEVESDFGCIDDLTLNFDIFDLPEVNAEYNYFPNPACGFNVEVNLSSNLSNDVIYSYWDLSWLPNPIIEFVTEIDTVINQPGENLILLTALNQNNCKVMDSLEINVYPPPIANFTTNISSGCEELLITFYDNSSSDTSLIDGSNGINNWQWDFGNNIQAYGQGPHIIPFNVSNNLLIQDYDINLIVTSDGNCVDTSLSSIQVFASPQPIINFEEINEPIPHGEYILSAENSLTSSGNIAGSDFNYIWLIDGQQIGTGMSLQYQFQSNSSFSNSTYQLCLEMQGENICISDTCIDITIDFFKGLHVPNALTPNANNSSIQEFKPSGKSLIYYSLEIYDTYGNMIWKTTRIDPQDGSPLTGWKGKKMDGTPVPQGVYVWKIEAQFSDGTYWKNTDENKQVGSITLIR
jgi:PKD repeat protein